MELGLIMPNVRVPAKPYFDFRMSTVKAYAKINLGLRILQKRGDGYHDVETVFHRVNLFDEISLEQASSISFTSTDPNLPADDSNLCIRAANLLQQYDDIRKGARISLVKNIPVGAGLGGGSSDAASTLLGLIELWNIKMPDELLPSVALRLGSDVPYFLSNGSAYATGRGEVLEYFNLDIPYWIVVAYPNIHVSTAWAYGAIHDEKFNRHAINHTGPLSIHESSLASRISLKDFLIKNIQNPHELNHHLQNDFEPVVLHEYGQIGYAKLILYSEGACFAQMSGSGSAVYGFFTDEMNATAAAIKLRALNRVFITPPYFKPE